MSTRVVCDRCGETLRMDGDGFYRIDAVHVSSLVKNARAMELDLCPRCLDALRVWLVDGKEVAR